MVRTQDFTFGDLLRRLRIEAGKTQEELAERAGLSVRGISDLERGVNRWPYRSTVLRLIEALGLENQQAAELRTLASRRIDPGARDRQTLHRLPIPLSPILGREREVAMVLHLLDLEGRRLVTLTGTGGVGKTRLALEVARQVEGEYDDGAVFVSLGSLADPAVVPSSVAGVLGITPNPATSPEEALQRFLADREIFLVLDNFEHLLPAAGVVARLLARSPRLKVLVTSREPLRLRGEQQIDLGPLAVPSPAHLATLGDLEQFPAVALFMRRAREVLPQIVIDAADVASVVEVCRRLDGLPLAIELAAGELKYQSPQSLRTQLSQRLDLLQGGARDLPVRQQTMQNTLTWSYQLLSGDEQRLFRRLAVFAGGCTSAAAHAICGDGKHAALVPLLHSLVDKSMLVAERGQKGEPRFRVLEVLRQYAGEHLEVSGEGGAIRQRQVQYFLQLAEDLEEEMGGTLAESALARLDMELDNFRAALVWSCQQNDMEHLLRLASALVLFWRSRGYVREGLGWLDAGLARSDGCSPRTRAKALTAAGWLTYFVDLDTGNLTRTEGLVKEALGLYHELDDRPGVAHALNRLGVAARARDLPEARAYFEQALVLATELGSSPLRTGVLINLADLSWREGDPERSGALTREALVLAREDQDIFSIGVALEILGGNALGERDYRQAKRLLEESVASFRKVGDNVYLCPPLGRLGEALLALAELDRARACFDEELTLAREQGIELTMAQALSYLGIASMLAGDCQRAATYQRESLIICRQRGNTRGIVDCLEGLAAVAHATGDAERTVRLYAAAERWRDRVHGPRSGLYSDLFERSLAGTRTQLASARWQRVWSEGDRMELEHAIHYALESSLAR